MERYGLTVTAARSTGETVLALRGEIDINTVGRFREAVEAELASTPPLLVLDMAGVTFCDSTGLGNLVRLSRTACAQGSPIVLSEVTAALHRVLDMTGLLTVLTVREAFPGPASGQAVG